MVLLHAWRLRRRFFLAQLLAGALLVVAWPAATQATAETDMRLAQKGWFDWGSEPAPAKTAPAEPAHAQPPSAIPESEAPNPSTVTAQSKSGTGPATAEPQPPAAWAVNCSDRNQAKFACEMTQLIIDEKSHSALLLVSVQGASDAGSKVMLIRVVHGVYLPAGLSVRIDAGQATQVAFQKSDASGVYAALPLTDPLIAALKTGKELKVEAQLNKGEPLTFVARLAGFGPAYDRLGMVR